MAERDLNSEQNERLRTLLRQLVERFGGQVALAAKLGRTQSTISGIINGRQGGSFAMAHAAAKLAGVDPSTVIDGTKSATPPATVVDYGPIDPRIPEWVRAGIVSAQAAEMLGPFATGAAKRSDVELLTALKAAENALSLVTDTTEDEKPRKRRR